MLSKTKFWIMTVILIGMIAILSVDYFLTPYLFSLIDPFASSIIVEGIMVAIIVGASLWHTFKVAENYYLMIK
jgi:hypothetical protein